MVRPGDELVNPVTGLRTVFRETAWTTGGELLQVDWIGPPGWTIPDHLHPRQEERLEVLRGRLGLRADGGVTFHGPGDVAVVPAGAPHGAWNAGAGELHLLVDLSPALRTEAAFEACAGLARDGLTTPAGLPRNPLRLAVVLRYFEDELRLVRPPLGAPRAFLAPLAAVGRVLGYRGDHPYPHEERSGSPDRARPFVNRKPVQPTDEETT